MQQIQILPFRTFFSFFFFNLQLLQSTITEPVGKEGSLYLLTPIIFANIIVKKYQIVIVAWKLLFAIGHKHVQSVLSTI